MAKYTFEPTRKLEKCYICGKKNATVQLVAVEPEKETGYVDEVPLCEECIQERNL